MGIVNAAVWSDLDGDGLPELILACEWGPIRVFQNESGRLREVTAELGLAPYTGWWRGVTTGDVNGNGKLDIIAANWGLNSPYQASLAHPVRFLYGDLIGQGRYDIIETDYAPENGAIVPGRDFNAFAPSLPFLYERYRSFRQFSESTVPQMLGEHLAKARQVTATTLGSMVFLNAQPRFEPLLLPREAQLAPASAVVVADLDADGLEDLFLSQNFFAVRAELGRQDAGRGLWLKGDGKGGFNALNPQTSGVRIYGEQRGAAVADFDGDGRLDLAVAQKGGAIKLYRGAGMTPALRVRLEGPPLNPDGAGAVVRLGKTNNWGPARTVPSGSGYWSQSGATMILGRPSNAEYLRVHWPGGAEQVVQVPAGVREVTVRLADRP